MMPEIRDRNQAHQVDHPYAHDAGRNMLVPELCSGYDRLCRECTGSRQKCHPCL